MNLRPLGRTGLKVSSLCMGTMQFGWTTPEPAAYLILDAALEAGINFFDTADIYSRWAEGNPGGVAEEILGRWIKNRAIPRDRLVLATKVRGKMSDAPGDEGLSRAHILASVENSLRRLQTDYLDLYQAHWPDEETPIEETLRAFDDLVQTGKVRLIGASNYPAWRLMQSLWAAQQNNLTAFSTLQPHYNLLHRAEFERELAEVCRVYGVGVMPYSPLAGGFLTGKYRPNLPLPESARTGSVQHRYFNERGWKTLEVLQTLAAQKECSLSAIALAWLLASPLISSPVIGPTRLEQLTENLQAAQIELTAEEVTWLNQTTDWKALPEG